MTLQFQQDHNPFLDVMASSRVIQKKWVENFKRSPLVNKETRKFNKGIAYQLFYGRNDPEYPADFPQDFQGFYNNQYENDRNSCIDTCLHFLHFIGIRLSKEAVLKQLQLNSADFHKVLKKTFFILRTLAHHREDLDTANPYRDNLFDLSYLIRLETGQSQLALFEDMELPQLYSRDFKIPEGYENDQIIHNLFEAIEGSTDSFFITGKAGTGKSTFIRYFTQKTKKQVLLTAFTGIAAINVGGVTIHSFFNFPFRALLPGDEEIKIFNENDPRKKIIQETDTIVIDEVSMLRADILQAIDYSLRNNGGERSKLFGGKQLLFVGDIFQLPPISDESDDVDRYLFNELYNSPYFFDCDAYRDLNPHFFEFTKSQRQKEDLQFVNLLDKVRTCSIDKETLSKLNERFDPTYAPAAEEFAITLTTNNYIARKVNDAQLRELPFTKYTFDADVKGDFDERKYPTNVKLELKKNAQVVFIKNDAGARRRWVNGTIGKIDFVANDVIEVKLPDGSVHPLSKETWEHRGYRYDRAKRKIISEAKGTFTQYPIKLAWAITIHKSQGLTFDNVIIDLGSGAFVNGQVYTALSRCRKLDGITLRRAIRPTDIIHDPRLIEFYNRLGIPAFLET